MKWQGTPKQLRAHLKRESSAGGHGIEEIAAGFTPEHAHNQDHADWPRLLSQDEGHEHPTEG